MSLPVFGGQPGVQQPMLTTLKTLYLGNKSRAARQHSDIVGPPARILTFLSKISFSMDKRTSLVGTPGSSSRVSTISSLIGRFCPPNLIPPALLISSIESIIHLSPL